MGWIFFLIILLIVFWPVIRIAWAVHRTRRRFRQAYEQAYEQAYGTPPPGAAGSRRRRKQQQQQQQQPRRRRKIIAKDVGEYVDFEEISVFTASTPDPGERAPVTYTVESQIEDAEWEEISNK